MKKQRCCPCEKLDGCVCRCHSKERRRIGKDFWAWFYEYANDGESCEEAIERITGVKDPGVKTRKQKEDVLPKPKKIKMVPKSFIKRCEAVQKEGWEEDVEKVSDWLFNKGKNPYMIPIRTVKNIVNKALATQRQEVEEMVEYAKDDMSGTYDYDKIAEGVIEWLRNKEGRKV